MGNPEAEFEFQQEVEEALSAMRREDDQEGGPLRRRPGQGQEQVAVQQVEESHWRAGEQKATAGAEGM